MRLWPPTFTMGNFTNAFDGLDVPNTEGAILNLANALHDTMGGVLGGGPSADQGGSGGGMTGGAGDASRAPGPGPSGGGGAGPNGSSGGSDGGQGTAGGRTTQTVCGKTTVTPTTDRDDSKNKSPNSDTINTGGNAAMNHPGGGMPATDNSTCHGGLSKTIQSLLGCPPCFGKRLLKELFGA